MWNPIDFYYELLDDGMTSDQAMDEVIQSYHLIHGGKLEDCKKAVETLIDDD